MPSPSEKELFTIGIFGSNGKTSTANMLSHMFNEANLSLKVVDSTKYVVHEKNMTNTGQNKQLKNFDNNGIILIEINKEMLRNKTFYKYDFDILIHCSISEDSYESSKEGMQNINSLINSGHNTKTVLLNTDDKNWKNIVVNLNNTYLIAYGLGSKATVTASSIECSKEIRFLFCLQRFLTRYDNKIIAPMEIPIVINAIGQYNVYNCLAAIATALILGLPADIIVSALNGNIGNPGLKILYENGFCVIDNVCDTILSLESGFEAVQNLPYENIYLIFDLNNKNKAQIKKIMSVIGAWSVILKIKKIYILNDDIELFNNTAGFRDAAFLKSSLENVEGIINSLEDKDMLLFFCSSAFNYLRDKITEILDRRILGNLS